LERLLGRRRLGIVLSTHTDEDGTFLHACKMGLEGVVSKRLSAPYRSGPSRDWIKVKNPSSPAMVRHREDRWWRWTISKPSLTIGLAWGGRSAPFLSASTLGRDSRLRQRSLAGELDAMQAKKMRLGVHDTNSPSKNHRSEVTHTSNDYTT
jgi:hypothetical protein